MKLPDATRILKKGLSKAEMAEIERNLGLLVGSLPVLECDLSHFHQIGTSTWEAPDAEFVLQWVICSRYYRIGIVSHVFYDKSSAKPYWCRWVRLQSPQNVAA